MIKIILIIVLVIFIVIISGIWAYNIDKMNEEHRDYKGDDFLNSDINE